MFSPLHYVVPMISLSVNVIFLKRPPENNSSENLEPIRRRFGSKSVGFGVSWSEVTKIHMKVKGEGGTIEIVFDFIRYVRHKKKSIFLDTI